MKLSKKDVVGIVATLSKDTTRPGMCHAAYCARQEVVFATDGHRLAVVREELAAPPKNWPKLTWDVETIYPIPRATLEAAAKAAKKHDAIELRAHPTSVEVVSGGVTLEVPKGDASIFPPMLQVLKASPPAQKAGTPLIGLNADYLADAIAIASDATSSKVVMRFGADPLDPMRVESPDGRVVVLIMPMRL